MKVFWRTVFLCLIGTVIGTAIGLPIARMTGGTIHWVNLIAVEITIFSVSVCFSLWMRRAKW